MCWAAPGAPSHQPPEGGQGWTLRGPRGGLPAREPLRPISSLGQTTQLDPTPETWQGSVTRPGGSESSPAASTAQFSPRLAVGFQSPRPHEARVPRPSETQICLDNLCPGQKAMCRVCSTCFRHCHVHLALSALIPPASGGSEVAAGAGLPHTAPHIPKVQKPVLGSLELTFTLLGSGCSRGPFWPAMRPF